MKIFERTRKSGAEVISLKGGAGYAVGVAILEVIKALAYDTKAILPVSTWVEGEYGLRDVCLSVPPRLGRHGTILTDAGRFNIQRAELTRSDEPLDPTCPCPVCATYSRGYLRHLVSVREPTAATLCTLHNLAWMFRFVGRIRRAILAGTLADLRREIAEVWSPVAVSPRVRTSLDPS